VDIDECSFGSHGRADEREEQAAALFGMITFTLSDGDDNVR
jgi:hypothetical protein